MVVITNVLTDFQFYFSLDNSSRLNGWHYECSYRRLTLFLFSYARNSSSHGMCQNHVKVCCRAGKETCFLMVFCLNIWELLGLGVCLHRTDFN